MEEKRLTWSWECCACQKALLSAVLPPLDPSSSSFSSGHLSVSPSSRKLSTMFDRLMSLSIASSITIATECVLINS
jgi:hypothetical protein